MGQMGQAISNPNTYAPDPSGFNKSEWAARFAGGAAKGLGQGLQNMQGQQRPQGGAMPIQQTPPPQVQLQQPINFTQKRADPFYG